MTVATIRKKASKSHSRRSRMRLWKKLLFSVAVTIVFFVLFELILTAIGVTPVLYDEDPYVGFASNVPLFVEQPGDGGVTHMVTAENRLSLFNHQRFPKNKPTGAYRVFSMGGSTTYGRPYDHNASFATWLQEFLAAADGSREWEVINAGGISYASYRVAMLMEELVQYQPDLFIVYSGHNEFLERRTYQATLDTPPIVRNLHSRLLGTRTFSFIHRLVKKDDRSPDVEADGRDLLPAEVDAILDHTVGPESYTRDDELRNRVVLHYRYSLERMVAIARSAGAKVIFVTPASNLRDFLPFKNEHRADLDLVDENLWLGHLHVAGEAFDKEQFHEALKALDQAAEIDDRHARLHFLRGRVLLRLKRYKEAKRAFMRARDEDVCPLRALTPMRNIVVDVAEANDASVIDFVRMMDKRAQDGIPGDESFLDHVHPTVEGHRLLALTLLDEMQEMGIAKSGPALTEQTLNDVTARVKGRLDHRAHANALRNLAKVLRWAGKFEQSAKLAVKAVGGLPDDAEAHYMAADARWQSGHLDIAVAEYELALSIDPDYLAAILQLGSLLLEKGEPEAAKNYLGRAVRLAPDKADPHFRLANALFTLEDLDEARKEYQESLRLEPKLADAHKNLALIAVQRNDLNTAVDHFGQALDIDPRDAVAHCELGFLFVDTKKLDLAVDEFSAALLLNPDHIQAYLGLGRAAEAQGDLDEAAKMYGQALDIDPDNAEAREKFERVAKP